MKVSEARQVVQSVVEAHATHNTFLSVWNDVKEKPTEPEYPIVVWDQWRARLIERGVTSLVRLIQIRLIIITSVVTDRTAQQRDDAVEDADNAAADFILFLRDTEKWNITDVSTSTQFDESTQLETGVILTFTVETDALCADDDAFDPINQPVTITINGDDYVEAPAGSTENIEVVDQNGDPVGSLVDGQWVVNTTGEEMATILPYDDDAAALADDTTVPTDTQLVYVKSTKRYYPGTGTDAVDVLVTAQTFLLPTTEISKGFQVTHQGIDSIIVPEQL